MIPVRGNTAIAAAATGRGASVMTPVSVILVGPHNLGVYFFPSSLGTGIKSK